VPVADDASDGEVLVVGKQPVSDRGERVEHCTKADTQNILSLKPEYWN
jgi:hypothetical protein